MREAPGRNPARAWAGRTILSAAFAFCLPGKAAYAGPLPPRAAAGPLASASASIGNAPLATATRPPAAAPEDGAIADSGENEDSIVAEADSAARAVLGEADPAATGPAEEPAPPLWLETYGEGVYSSQEDDDLAGFTDWKVGKRLPGPFRADVYAKVRVYRDQREFYWNNRADAGLGARIPLLRKVALSAFAEATWGHYLSLSSSTQAAERLQGLIENNRVAIAKAYDQALAFGGPIALANALKDRQIDRSTLEGLDTLADQVLKTLEDQLDTLETTRDSLYDVMDALALVPAGSVNEYKAGLVFWNGWGSPGSDGPAASWMAFPFRPWGDVYADCIASSLERHVRARHGTAYIDSTVHIRNIVLYANPSVGWVVMDGKAGALAAFASAYAWLDTRGDWWNNRAMGGLGLRYQPFAELDFAIKGEYLAGGFYGRERKSDPNPYGRTFTDTRVTAGFWHGLGI